MDKRCKHVRQDGFNCGSYAFNLYKDDIDQGDLCDVHYWQAKAQRTEQNFCSRCGKRTADLTTIHTCTPPQENTWVGLTKEDKD